MKVYIETNFILELAFLQEQHESCDRILSLCENSSIGLVLPAFCIGEVYETLIRRSKKRTQLTQDLGSELRQLARSKPYKLEVDAFQNIIGLLVRSSQEEDERLTKCLDRILKLTNIVSLGADIVLSATQYRVQFKLQPQDAIIYASVIHHLTTLTEESCFLNRNRNDFDDPDIEDSLNNYGCKMLFNFDNAYNYIRSRIPTAGST